MYEKALQPEPKKESLAKRFYDSELSHLPTESIHEFISEIRLIAKSRRDQYIEESIMELRDREADLKRLATLEY